MTNIAAVPTMTDFVTGQITLSIVMMSHENLADHVLCSAER